jgi:hypothetical protein
VGEEVEGFDGFEAIGGLEEELEVAREGGGVAGDVEDRGGLELGDPGDGFGGEAGAGRVDDDEIDFFGHAGGQGVVDVGGDHLDVGDAVEGEVLAGGVDGGREAFDGDDAVGDGGEVEGDGAGAGEEVEGGPRGGRGGRRVRGRG